MPEQEDIDHQRTLLATYRRNLAHFLRQQANLGEDYAPAGLFNSILECRENIARIKGILRGWNIEVADHPDDVAPLETESTAKKSRPAGGPTYIFQGGTFNAPVGQSGGSSSAFNQQGWNVSGGNVYNIAGDMHIGASPNKDEFLTALRQFKAELDKAKDLPPDEADDLHSNLDAATRAIERAEPNKERMVEKLSTMQKMLDGLKDNVGSAVALGQLIAQVIRAAHGISF